MAFLLRFAKERPFLFGLGYSFVKTVGCDLMVQKVVEKRESIDWRRTAAFGSFGLFYLGGVQYALYVPVFSRLFPNAASFAAKSVPDKLRDGRGIRDLFAQVFLDQFVHHPLLYFPVFYSIKEIVTSDAPDLYKAIGKYRENMTEDLQALWKVWVPSTFLNFAFMPMWARIPWVASTSLIWTCILSAMRGSSDIPTGEVLGPHVDARTLELLSRTLIGRAPVLDTSRAHLLVSVHGPDRPGVIADLSSRIYGNGGLVSTSKMMQLGSDFSIMMHVSCEPHELRNVLDGLHKLQSGEDSLANCEIQVRQVEATPHLEKSLYSAHVSLSGEDRPGLLFHLSEVLSAHGLNIDHMQTEQHARTGSNSKQCFTLHGHVVGQSEPDATSLSSAISKLEGDLRVVCKLQRADSSTER